MTKSKRPLYFALLTALASVPFVFGFSEPNLIGPAIRQFGQKMDTVLEKPGENTIFSPWNIGTLLGLAGEGARGDTELAFWELLGLPSSGDKAGFKEAIHTLNVHGPMQLSNGVGLWLQSGMLFNPLFQQTAVDVFNGQLAQVNFKEHPDDARKEINHWISLKTHGKIPDLLKPGSVKKDTKVVLASTLYMNAPFLFPFSLSNSHRDTFTPSNGKEFPITFMQQTSNLNYYEDDFVQIVEVPYKSNPLDVVLWILLPKGDVRPIDVDTYGPHLMAARVDLKIPKMEVRSSYDLKKPLQALGFVLPFTMAADFTGMVAGQVELTDIIHEAYMSWDEKGTEAAAATGTVFTTTRYMPEEKIIPFHANRPFSFLIWEKSTGIPLFQGHIDTPKPFLGRTDLTDNLLDD